MRVVCRHGHFAFYPRRAGDIQQFSNSFGVELVAKEDYFTFDFLSDAENYSLDGLAYLNLTASESFEGAPWQVMKQNGFVYDIMNSVLIPKTSITGICELTQKGFFYVASTPLIQPGVRTILGDQILSYSGEFYEDKYYLRIVEFRNE